jgi:hypothetical protein
MPSHQEPPESHVRMSDDAAHRILARAIELERTGGPETTVAQLRDVAREAGISMTAFDSALREAERVSIHDRTPAPARGVLSRLWARVKQRGAAEVNAADVLTVSVASLLTFWLVAFVLTRFAVASGWQAMELTILASSLMGVYIARKLGARVVALGLLGFAAFQAAEFAMHALFGIESVQGGPTHWAVMLAGVLGALLGARFERGAGRTPAAASEVQRVKVSSAESPTDAGTNGSLSESLRFGLRARPSSI